MNQPLARHLFYLSDFDLCSMLEKAGFREIGQRRKGLHRRTLFHHGSHQHQYKVVKIPKNYTLKKLEGHNWFIISMPVVFREGEYAIYYSKGEYSGQFVLMKKIGGSWIEVCYSSVYSE